MKINNTLVATLGALSLLSVIAIAAEEKTPATVEKMADKVMVSPKVEADETITVTMRVHAVDLKKRQITLENQEGNFVTMDVPAEVRRLPEIKAGDLVVARYNQAMAVALNKAAGGSGIRVRRESSSVERAGKDEPPGAVTRQNVEVLANIIAIDRAKRLVTLKGVHQTVVLKASEDIDIDDMKVGDEVLAHYTQEWAVALDPASASVMDAWKSKK